jgi:hypothetical protein
MTFYEFIHIYSRINTDTWLPLWALWALSVGAKRKSRHKTGQSEMWIPLSGFYSFFRWYYGLKLLNVFSFHTFHLREIDHRYGAMA